MFSVDEITDLSLLSQKIYINLVVTWCCVLGSTSIIQIHQFLVKIGNISVYSPGVFSPLKEWMGGVFQCSKCYEKMQIYILFMGGLKSLFWINIKYLPVCSLFLWFWSFPSITLWICHESLWLKFWKMSLLKTSCWQIH